MALVGIELETLVSEPDALTTRPPVSCDTTWLDTEKIIMLAIFLIIPQAFFICVITVLIEQKLH